MEYKTYLKISKQKIFILFCPILTHKLHGAEFYLGSYEPLG